MFWVIGQLLLQLSWITFIACLVSPPRAKTAVLSLVRSGLASAFRHGDSKSFDNTPLYVPRGIDFEGCYDAERAVWQHTFWHAGWPPPKRNDMILADPEQEVVRHLVNISIVIPPAPSYSLALMVHYHDEDDPS